jgi:hypothetical protein
MRQVGGFHQIPDCRGICTTQRDRLFHRRSHPVVAVVFDQTQHLNHLARAARLTVSIYKLCEQLIVTLGPQSPLTPRSERF